VVRVRIGEDAGFHTYPVTDNTGLDKKTGDPTFHIDIKSETLQEILRKVLHGVKGLCLAGEKPTVPIHMKSN
jgi:hypothetical protein